MTIDLITDEEIEEWERAPAGLAMRSDTASRLVARLREAERLLDVIFIVHPHKHIRGCLCVDCEDTRAYFARVRQS